MPIDSADLRPNALQIGLQNPPMLLGTVDLKQVFADLDRLGYNTYNQLPDGGAAFGNTQGSRQLIVQASQRNLTASVDLDIARAVDEALDALTVIERRIPVAMYFLWQATLTSHLRVTGETATALLDRTVFREREEALAILGPDRFGAGVRVILGNGQAALTVEPLVARPDMLFVQYYVHRPGAIALNGLRGMLEAVLHFQNHQIRDFIQRLIV